MTGAGTASDPTRILRGGRPEPGAAAARVESLYTEHRDTVLRLCRGLLRDRVEAEDAAQQTFLSAQRALANGSAPEEPVAWLVAIARNECLSRVRGRMREALPTDDEPAGAAPDAHAAAVRREETASLRDALASLPPQQRDALLLRELRGLSYGEVAASLAVSTSAVESLLVRARRGVQARLGDAAAALSPVGWGAPLRELAARLAGGGAAAPFAAKAVVVGLGSAALAGGVVETPRLIGNGHAPASPPAAARAPQHHSARQALVFPAIPVARSTERTVAPPAAPRQENRAGEGERRSATPEREGGGGGEDGGATGAPPEAQQQQQQKSDGQQPEAQQVEPQQVEAPQVASSEDGGPQVFTATTSDGDSSSGDALGGGDG